MRTRGWLLTSSARDALAACRALCTVHVHAGLHIALPRPLAFRSFACLGHRWPLGERKPSSRSTARLTPICLSHGALFLVFFAKLLLFPPGISLILHLEAHSLTPQGVFPLNFWCVAIWAVIPDRHLGRGQFLALVSISGSLCFHCAQCPDIAAGRRRTSAFQCRTHSRSDTMHGPACMAELLRKGGGYPRPRP
jgi:hypothetical protein